MKCKACQNKSTELYCGDCQELYNQLGMQRSSSKQVAQMTLNAVESDEKINQEEAQEYLVQISGEVDDIYDMILGTNNLQDYREDLKYGQS